MNRRTLLASACVCLVGLTPLSSAYADSLDNIEKSGVLRVAVLSDYPPYGSIGPDMKPIGIDIDLANAIVEKLGVKAELVPTTGPNRIPLLQTGKVDIIIGGLGRNAEREKIIDYGPAYSMDYNAVYGPAELAASKPEDFVGKSVAVVRGSTEDLGFSAIAPEGVVIKRFEDNNGTQSAYEVRASRLRRDLKFGRQRPQHGELAQTHRKDDPVQRRRLAVLCRLAQERAEAQRKAE